VTKVRDSFYFELDSTRCTPEFDNEKDLPHGFYTIKVGRLKCGVFFRSYNDNFSSSMCNSCEEDRIPA
jgi:hypothetical protein